MSREPFLPTLKILINDNHRILKLRTAHGTGDSYSRIFFVPGPYLKTFCVKTFLAHFTRRITLTIHIFVTNRTHGILFQRREVLWLLAGGSPRYSLELMFLGRLSSPLCVFQLNKTLQFRVQIRS